MLRRRISLTSYLLGLVLLTSCASTPDHIAVAAVGSASTPTPFQPGGSTSPFDNVLGTTQGPSSGTSLTPFPEVTFTPYPTVSVRGGALAFPDVSPPPGGTSFSPVAIDPLTGLPPADPSFLDRRPVAIKVTNYPRYIRPQYGLTEADVVFEYYIEDLLTRFIAVFYGNNPDQVGPVRSGRYFDEHVVRMYNAFYVFQYADPRELTYFKSGDLNQFLVLQGYGDCPPFFNSRRKIEIYNNAFFDLTRWNDCAAREGRDNSRPSLRSGFFSPNVPAGGYVVSRIFTHYSVDDYNYWQYDPASGRYLRYQETDDTRNGKPASYAPLMDDLTGRQVAADNVIELFVSHTFANQGEQEDEVYHINLVDSGTAFVFRDGFAFPAHWIRTDVNQPLLITNISGTPMYLKPGVTFYQVIGETSTDWSDGTDWHFDFHTP